MRFRQPGDRLGRLLPPLHLRDFLLWPVSRINKTAWSVCIVAVPLGVLKIGLEKTGGIPSLHSFSNPARDIAGHAALR